MAIASNKYFTRTVKPTMTASLQHTAAFSDDDVLFSWTSFEIPEECRLLGVTALIRGTDGVRQEQPLDLYFSKKAQAGDIAALGAINATANGVGWFNDLIGFINIAAGDYGDGLDTMAVASSSGSRQIMTSQRITSLTPGTATVYVGGIAQGALDFRSGLQVNEASFTGGTQTTITVDQVDATIAFSPGDLIHAHDDAVLGTIESITSANEIVLTKSSLSSQGNIANNDYLYNVNPITLILSLEV